MSKLRVYEAARDLGIDNRALVGLLQSRGVPDIRNHMSVVPVDAIDNLKRDLAERVRSPQPVAISSQAASVQSSTARLATPRKEAAKTPESVAENPNPTTVEAATKVPDGSTGTVIARAIEHTSAAVHGVEVTHSRDKPSVTTRPSSPLVESFRVQIVSALAMSDIVARLQYLNSVMQCAAISAAEYWVHYGEEIDDPEAGAAVARLLHPVDGVPKDVLNLVLPSLESSAWPSCARRWFEKTPGSDGQGACRALVRQAEDWVRYRNARPGHGVQDRISSQAALEWIAPFASELLSGLDALVPSVADNGTLVLDGPAGPIKIEAYRLVDGKPVVVLDIKRRGSTWAARYQVLDPESSPETVCALDATMRLLASARSAGRFQSRQVDLNAGTWRTTTLLPHRQTTTFEGREEHLEAFRQWFDDPDSRACLVYGEGGIGKTTLVLEFLHRVLDGEIPDIKWQPDVVCFFTAKMTRWTPDGLKHIRGTAPAVVDAVRRLALVVEDRLTSDWYTAEPLAVVDRVAGLLQQAGTGRSKVLLVIDNTETLARVSSEEKELARILERVAARVGKLIMTSRRREDVEARPIRVHPLADEAGAALLERLAAVYGAKPLADTGLAGRLRFSRKLGGRPLGLEFFARAAAVPGRSLDAALESVFQAAGADLGQFLFEDAWKRIPTEVRDVFLTMSLFDDGMDSTVVARTCAALHVSPDDWLQAFDETRFGALVEHGAYYDVTLSHDVLRYLGNKFEAMAPADRERLRGHARTVEAKVSSLLKAGDTPITDRIRDAYRTSAAKAAKLAAARGANDDAKMWYEEAVTIDESNAGLWDRYAWFLMVKLADLEHAQRCAARAVGLAPADPDAVFTAGMIAARRGEVGSADRLLGQAESNGKEAHLCALQKARARLEAVKALPQRQRVGLRVEARRLIQLARSVALGVPMRSKHLRECDKMMHRLEHGPFDDQDSGNDLR